MKRYDLRHLKQNFLTRMGELINHSAIGEVSIFLFEIGDFSAITKSAELVDSLNSTLLNSLKFNHVDWMIVVRKGKI